jgi:choline dehydrogenase-like flavoprotein
MIRDVFELNDGAILRAEVGIVGAGFAGIDLARYLAHRGVRVVLLESGRLNFEPETQALTRIDSVGKPVRFPDPEGRFTPYLAPIYRGETRLRQFGGTSNIWTGKWRTFDPIDFEKRPWIPHSGWPITIDELRPWYDEIARDYGLADFNVFAHCSSNARLREAITAGGLKLSFHFWAKEPIRLASRFHQEFKEAANLQVVLGANATEIVLDNDLRHARAIVFQSLERRQFRLAANHFVLATGGLEASRLLLASNRQIPAGIGNGRGLVRRFYMDHPKHKRGKLWPGAAFKLIGNKAVSRPRPRFLVSFSLSDDVQRTQSLPNHAIYFAPVYHYDIDYPIERILRIKSAWQTARPQHALSPAVALALSPQALLKIAQQQIYRRRGGPIAHCAVSMYVEQVPNPESRLYLGPERDLLGMPKLVVDWRLTSWEQESFQRLLRGLTDACAQAGIGRLEFGPLTFDDTVDAAHHMGATRMAAGPKEGVVDRHCKVFDTNNLFIASSSVFPTGHSAAPTFTILALARRLGSHLLDKCRRSSELSVA